MWRQYRSPQMTGQGRCLGCCCFCCVVTAVCFRFCCVVTAGCFRFCVVTADCCCFCVVIADWASSGRRRSSGWISDPEADQQKEKKKKRLRSELKQVLLSRKSKIIQQRSFQHDQKRVRRQNSRTDPNDNRETHTTCCITEGRATSDLG